MGQITMPVIPATSAEPREHMAEEKVRYGVATRSKKPRYSLIPKSALDAMAARFELGEIKHQGTAWNALAPTRETALTKEWAIAAMEHVIGHAWLAMQKLEGLVEDDGDDDAGAILFGGAVLAEYKRVRG